MLSITGLHSPHTMTNTVYGCWWEGDREPAHVTERWVGRGDGTRVYNTSADLECSLSRNSDIH